MAKLLNAFEAGAVDVKELTIKTNESDISFRNKRQNVKKAYDAAIKY